MVRIARLEVPIGRGQPQQIASEFLTGQDLRIGR
jgi:hypothetical protein